MGQLGLGVMIGQLFGGDRGAPVRAAIGKEIQSVTLGDDDALHFVMADGTKFRIYDDGQSCCESRYMQTDDKLDEFAGAKLTGIEIKDAPDVEGEDDYGDHEVQFLEVQTDRGVFTMSSHNEHNGYYGGFHIVSAEDA